MDVNVFKNKDTIFKYVMLGLKSIIFGVVLTIALSMALGCRFLKIISGSMSPKYNIGDVVVVSTKFKFEDLKVGDVITYKAGSNNVTHRIVDITTTGSLITQGDASGTVDTVGAITKEKYVGKVLFGIPKMGGFLETVSQPGNYAIIVIGVVLILFILIM